MEDWNSLTGQSIILSLHEQERDRESKRERERERVFLPRASAAEAALN